MWYNLFIKEGKEMELRNLFRRRKTLLTAFLFLALLLVLVSAVTYRGLVFDQPAIFFSVLSRENLYDFAYLFHNEPKTRLFSGIMFSVPMNMFVHYLPDNLVLKNSLFCFSYSIMTLVFLCFNIWLSKRTKRYDIAVWSVFFYTLLYLPNSVWFARNIHISVLMQFALLQYFLNRGKLRIFDYMCLIILSFGVWESSENAVLPASLMFLYTILNWKKLSAEKIFIGINSLFCCIYIVARTVVMAINGDQAMPIKDAFYEYFYNLYLSFHHLFDTCFIFTVAGCLIIAYLCLRNHKLKMLDVPLSVLIIGGAGYALWAQTKFEPCVSKELCFHMIPFVLMFFVTLFILFVEYKEIKFPKLYEKILTISLIIGCIHCCYQLNSCKYSSTYASEFLEKINKNEKITYIENQNEQSTAFRAYDTCFGTLHRTMILDREKAEEKFVLPYKDENNPQDFVACMTPTYYNADEDYVILQTALIFKYDKYFDMKKLKKLLEDTNIEYK